MKDFFVHVVDRCAKCKQPVNREINVPMLLQNLRSPGATNNERDAADVIEDLLSAHPGEGT